MDITPNQVATWAREELESFSAGKFYEHDSAMYAALAEKSGLSQQTVRLFHLGRQPNIGVDNLDRLVTAIKSVRERLRAA